jgi:bifunctional DNase/RNase
MPHIRVRVRGLMMDEHSKSPIVILQEEEGERILPIWIGEPEARSIGMVLAEEKLERPLSHDLMLTLVRSLHARVVSVTITALKENTFFAEIHLESGGQQILVDARPSDSIALALRAEAPIFVAEEVMGAGQVAAAGGAKLPEKSEKDKATELKKLLEDMDPGDFGRFGI